LEIGFIVIALPVRSALLFSSALSKLMLMLIIVQRGGAAVSGEESFVPELD
jgi:hypothetical protein